MGRTMHQAGVDVGHTQGNGLGVTAWSSEGEPFGLGMSNFWEMLTSTLPVCPALRPKPKSLASFI